MDWSRADPVRSGNAGSAMTGEGSGKEERCCSLLRVDAFELQFITGTGEESMRVLLIEDDPVVVEIVSLCFEIRWPDVCVVQAQLG